MKTLKTMLGENVYLVKMTNKEGKTMVRQYRAPSILSAESKAKVDAKIRGYSVESVRELSKEKDDLDEARYVTSADYKVSASGRKVHKRKKIADDDYEKEDEVEDEDEKEDKDEKKESFNFDTMEQIEEDVWYCGDDLDLQLDEAQQRYSSSYQFTHKPGDEESEKKLAGLKKMVKGTGKRVVLMGRLGKDNPNAHKYAKGGSAAAGKSGRAHQYIHKKDAAHHDVYVYDRRESVEHIEEKRGLWDNIHAKRARIKAGSGERMRKPGSEGAPTAADFKASQTEETQIEEAVSVKKADYSWGKMVTVHHGSDTSYPLHPEHQKKIAALKHGEKTSFKDETNSTVHAEREDDKVHLSRPKTSSTKTTVAHSHFTESTQIDEAMDPQEARFMQLARLGLVDKTDVAKLRMAMSQLNSDKALNIKQRELLLSTLQSLVDIVTGDDAVFTRVRMDVQKESIDFDKIRADAATHLKKSIDKQSDDRIAAAKNPPKKPGFFARVGQKQINMVKGAWHGLTKEGKDEVPFEGPYKKVKDVVTDKSGAKHTPVSRVRHLARLALKKQTEKK